MVSRDTCAIVGAELGLGNYLIIDQSERSTGGPEKRSLLANVVEAVIGAIYTDAGLEKARKFILKQWKVLLQASTEMSRDPKSALQEWAQGSGMAAPAYRLVTREGPDHAPVFTVAVEVDGRQPLQGVGNSKQVAEREAARAMLAAIGDIT
jgi:ribonuclease-3